MEQVQEAKDQARQKVQEASGKASGRVREQVDRRSTEAGERVSSVADDARSVGEELRKQGKDRPAQMVDQVAERADRLGGYLHESDADRILGDFEGFGRRQPWALVAGGVAVGFVASRFLKASSSKRYQASRGMTTANDSPEGVNGGGARPQLTPQTAVAESPPGPMAARGPVDEFAPES